MCLTNFGEKKVAQTNIVCYKSGSRRIPLLQRFNSVFMNYTYKRYKVQERAKLGIIELWDTVMSYTFGSSSPIYVRRSKGKVCEKGYHSYKTSSLIDSQIFLIPKGTIYIEGEVNNDGKEGYTSERIVWIGSRFNPINLLLVWLFKKNILNFDIKKDFEEITESMQIEGITTDIPGVDMSKVIPSHPRLIKENSDKVTI